MSLLPKPNTQILFPFPIQNFNVYIDQHLQRSVNQLFKVIDWLVTILVYIDLPSSKSNYSLKTVTVLIAWIFVYAVDSTVKIRMFSIY